MTMISNRNLARSERMAALASEGPPAVEMEPKNEEENLQEKKEGSIEQKKTSQMK